MVGAVCSWCCPWDPAQLGFKAAHTRASAAAGVHMPAHAYRLRQCRLRATERSLRGPRRGAATKLVPSRQRSLPTPERLHLDSSQTILLIGSSAHGCDVRAAAGAGPAVPSRSRPARSRRGSRGVCVSGRGVGAGVLLGCGRPRGSGTRRRGRPRARGGHRPPAAGALPEQRRSVARLGARSAGLLALLAFLLRGPPFSPRPRRPLPQPASPLPLCSPPRALSALTFPSPGQRRRAPRQPPAPLQTAGCERGCALYPVPASRGRSGENRTMPWARDCYAARRDGWALGFWVRQPWLGFFYLLPPTLPPLSTPPPPPPEEGSLRRTAPWTGGLWSAACSERLPLLPGRRFGLLSCRGTCAVIPCPIPPASLAISSLLSLVLSASGAGAWPQRLAG